MFRLKRLFAEAELDKAILSEFDKGGIEPPQPNFILNINCLVGIRTWALSQKSYSLPQYCRRKTVEFKRWRSAF